MELLFLQLKSNSNQIDLDLFRYSKGVYILKLIEGEILILKNYSSIEGF